MSRKLLIVLPVLAVFIAGGAYVAYIKSRPPAQPANVHLTTTTQNYNLLLAVAPPQQMFTPDQVRTEHPTNGEVMFSGTMVMPGSMPGMSGMSGSSSAQDGWHHVEVHIYSKGSNDVITDAHPVITVRDDATGKQTELPIVTMQGIAVGSSDFHYGNNVYMPSGQAYTVTVHVNGETAVFHVHL
jgi:hypothetical protein